MTARISLSSRLDSAASAELAAELKTHEGADIVLDASAAGQIGALAAQTILVAAATWAARGHGFAVVNLGPERRRDLELLGLSGQPAFAEGSAA